MEGRSVWRRGGLMGPEGRSEVVVRRASLDSHGRGNRLMCNVPQIVFGLFFSLRSTGLVNFGQE
jgi:hypothetical protein